jgi:dihydrofolate reductase
MKVTLIMVSTADGVIAKNSDHNAFTWTSSEDKKHFVDITKQIGTVIMGSKTFVASGRKSYKDRVGIVLTNNPDKYEAGENIYFMSGKSQEILDKISAMGIDHVALIGGAKTNAEFLSHNLVDEIFLTIEPIMFGKGIHIADEFDLDINLELINFTKLNNQGTILLQYKIIK